MFSGASGSSTDSGTFQRMYGTWLTWTQSRKEDVFVIATTNGVERLPPPALRKGRVDEIFFVDLPNDDEREAIFKIHLHKRGWGHIIDSIDLKKLAESTPNRTGSEIEQIVIQSLINKVNRVGFGKDKPLTTEDLEAAILSIRTGYDLNPDESDNIREWAKSHNVVFANRECESQKAQKTGKKAGSSGAIYTQSNKQITVDEGDI